MTWVAAGDAGEGGKVADGVACRREEVERAVAEEVVGWNLAQLQGERSIVEFAHRMACELRLLNTTLRIRRVGWGVSLHEPRPDDQFRARVERGQIATVVEMVMRPDDGRDGFRRDAQVSGVSVEDLIDVRCHSEGHDLFNEADRRRGEKGLPVLSHPQVEQYVPALFIVADEERVGWECKGLVPWQLGHEHYSRCDFPKACRVNDAHVYRRRRIWDAQLWRRHRSCQVYFVTHSDRDAAFL